MYIPFSGLRVKLEVFCGGRLFNEVCDVLRRLTENQMKAFAGCSAQCAYPADARPFGAAGGPAVADMTGIEEAVRPPG